MFCIVWKEATLSCLLENRAVFMMMHSYFGEWLQPWVWACWRRRRKRSTCVFWWNTVYIYTSLYTYLHIATCFCVAALVEAWTSRSPAKSLVVMEGELFSGPSFSRHSKVPRMEAFTPFHSLPRFSRDLLLSCWADRNSVTFWGPAVPPPSLAPAAFQQVGLSESAAKPVEKGTSLHPYGWRWEISRGKYKVNALVFPVQDSKPRNCTKTVSKSKTAPCNGCCLLFERCINLCYVSHKGRQDFFSSLLIILQPVILFNLHNTRSVNFIHVEKPKGMPVSFWIWRTLYFWVGKTKVEFGSVLSNACLFLDICLSREKLVLKVKTGCFANICLKMPTGCF